MSAGGLGGVRGCVEQWGALTLGDVDLRKLSVLIQVFIPRLLALFAVGRWHSSVWMAINGDVVNGKIGNGQSIEEKARHGVGGLIVYVGVLKEIVLAGVLALFEGGQATMAVEVWVEAGGLAVKRRQASVDTAGQGGVGGLAGERLDMDLQCNTLGDIGDREDVL